MTHPILQAYSDVNTYMETVCEDDMLTINRMQTVSRFGPSSDVLTVITSADSPVGLRVEKLGDTEEIAASGGTNIVIDGYHLGSLSMEPDTEG